MFGCLTLMFVWLSVSKNFTLPKEHGQMYLLLPHHLRLLLEQRRCGGVGEGQKSGTRELWEESYSESLRFSRGRMFAETQPHLKDQIIGQIDSKPPKTRLHRQNLFDQHIVTLEKVKILQLPSHWSFQIIKKMKSITVFQNQTVWNRLPRCCFLIISGKFQSHPPYPVESRGKQGIYLSLRKLWLETTDCVLDSLHSLFKWVYLICA